MLLPFAIKYYPVIQSLEHEVHSATAIQNKWKTYRITQFFKKIRKMPYYKNESAISGAVHNIARHEDALANILKQMNYKPFTPFNI